jgi:hypothetical protein
MIVLVIGGILGFLAWQFSKKNTKGLKPKVGYIHQYDEKRLSDNNKRWTGRDILESDLDGDLFEFQYKEVDVPKPDGQRRSDFHFFNPRNGREHTQRVNFDKQWIESAWNPQNVLDEEKANRKNIQHARKNFEESKKYEGHSCELENTDSRHTAYVRSNSSEARRKVTEFFAPFQKRPDYKDITEDDL